MLIVNADDYGRNRESTDRTLTCFAHERINSTSAMMFMTDSKRAAELALENQLPVGLHLNLDEQFTGQEASEALRYHLQSTARYLNKRKWNQVVYNPCLRNAFDYLYKSQLDEFCRLYHREPVHLDGHRHMHLCMNMLLSGRLPRGVRIRRNFTFRRGEKTPINRFYRRLIDQWLQWKFQCTDSFFSMHPVNPEKLQHLAVLSRTGSVEIMTHPGKDEEFIFLMSPEWRDILSCHDNWP